MAGNHVLLETIALTQSASSVTFDNIPQTGYTDLKIVTSTRLSSTDSPILVNFNGVTTGYSWRRIYGNGSSASSLSGSDGYFLHGNTSSTTANTFSNAEFYVPNYTASQSKSISVDTALETNATGGELFMLAALWANNAAITSILLTPLTGSFVAGSTFSIYGVAAVGTTPTVAPKATGGNIVANDGTYWYHAFTSSGTFTPQTPLTCDALVIAGGGGGGNNRGGGGGAGGLVYSASQSLTSINYAVQIGAGGPGAPAGTNTGGTSGVNSFLGSIVATGGGYGGGIVTLKNGAAGGSGGGGGGNDGSGIGTGGAASPAGQGNIGGNGNANSAGGGGGAGAAGQTAPSTSAGGTGGAGLNTYSSFASATSTGVSSFYAGGGGGGTYPSATIAGGSGGGGTGGSSSVNATAAIVNTGSGGGGSGEIGPGGAGGSGVVIIRYAMV
jgi:hypothetical protein